jgi:type VI protein secretion system component VasF
MSSLAATAPIRRATTAPTIAPLEIVATRPQRRARPRAAHAVAMVLGVFAILLTQLLLSISLSEGAYRITSLEATRAELSRSEQVLTESLDTLRSPQHLAMNAESLGMVANSSPAYLRLTDGRVLGAPVAAGAGSGLFDATSATIGNVLLAEVPLATHASTPSPAAPEAAAPGVAAPPAALATVPSPPGVIPSPVTR